MDIISSIWSTGALVEIWRIKRERVSYRGRDIEKERSKEDGQR